MNLLLKTLLLLLTFVLLLGCSEQSANQEELLPKTIKIDEIDLSPNDEEILNELNTFVNESILIMKELDILLEEFQKEDALDEAVDAMVIAREENELLYNKTVLLQPQSTSLQEQTEIFLNILDLLITGLKLQVEGIDQGDSQKVQEGFQLTEQYKNDLYNLADKNED